MFAPLASMSARARGANIRTKKLLKRFEDDFLELQSKNHIHYIAATHTSWYVPTIFCVLVARSGLGRVCLDTDPPASGSIGAPHPLSQKLLSLTTW